MASDNEACCESDPNFAVICGFLEKFGVTCGLANIDFLDLQDMLENSQEVPQELVDLHVKLLRKARKSVSSARWERAIIKLCHGFCSQDAWEIERFGYKKARLSSKLRILKELLEMQFDYNAKFKNEVNKLSAEELRTQPLGRDRLGHIYWFQSDNSCQIRVYKEDPDEETWALVAKDREGLVELITQLSDGNEAVVNEDSNSLESEKPIVDTGQTDSNSNSNSAKLDQTSSDTNTEEPREDANNKEEIEVEKPRASNEEYVTQNNTEIINPTKIILRTKKTLVSEDLSRVTEPDNSINNIENNGNITGEQENKNENLGKDERDSKLPVTVTPPKTGISIRIKPITELISPSAVEVNKKVEITGVKEKYIRSDSTSSSSVYHRKAVDSAGFDVHTNYLKRPIDEEEDVEEPSYMKRPRFDRPTLLGNKKKKPYSDEEDEEEEEEEVSDEVKEPLMLVRGEGSGQDNEAGNFQKGSESTEDDSPIVGEAIEESVVFFYGEGSGHECETGNDNNSDKKDATTQQQGVTENKADADSTLEPSKLDIQHTPQEAHKAEIIDSIKDSKPSSSFYEVDCSVKLSAKPEYKLGTIIDVRTNNLNPCVKNVTKKSRWDMRKPEEEIVESRSADDQANVTEKISSDVCVTNEKSKLFEGILDTKSQVLCNNSDMLESEILKKLDVKDKAEDSISSSSHLKNDNVVPPTPKGKVQELVNKWETHANKEVPKLLLIAEDTAQSAEAFTVDSTNNAAADHDSSEAAPKKSMFFFGPGCLKVKPTISPLKDNPSELLEAFEAESNLTKAAEEIANVNQEIYNKSDLEIKSNVELKSKIDETKNDGHSVELQQTRSKEELESHVFQDVLRKNSKNTPEEKSNIAGELKNDSDVKEIIKTPQMQTSNDFQIALKSIDSSELDEQNDSLISTLQVPDTEKSVACHSTHENKTDVSKSDENDSLIATLQIPETEKIYCLSTVENKETVSASDQSASSKDMHLEAALPIVETVKGRPENKPGMSESDQHASSKAEQKGTTPEVVDTAKAQTCSDPKALLKDTDYATKLQVLNKTEEVQLKKDYTIQGSKLAATNNSATSTDIKQVIANSEKESLQVSANIVESGPSQLKETKNAFVAEKTEDLLDIPSKGVSKSGIEVVKRDSIKCNIVKLPESNTCEVLNTAVVEAQDVVDKTSCNVIPANHHIPKNSISGSEKEMEKGKTSSPNDKETGDKLNDVPLIHKSIAENASTNAENKESKLEGVAEATGLPVIEKRVKNVGNKPKSKLENVLKKINQVKLIQKTDNVELSIKNKESLLPDSKLKSGSHSAETDSKTGSIEAQMAIIMGETLPDQHSADDEAAVSSSKIRITSDIKTPALVSKSDSNIINASSDDKNSRESIIAEAIPNSSSAKKVAAIEASHCSKKESDVKAQTMDNTKISSQESTSKRASSTNIKAPTLISSDVNKRVENRLKHGSEICSFKPPDNVFPSTKKGAAKVETCVPPIKASSEIVKHSSTKPQTINTAKQLHDKINVTLVNKPEVTQKAHVESKASGNIINLSSSKVEHTKEANVEVIDKMNKEQCDVKAASEIIQTCDKTSRDSKIQSLVTVPVVSAESFHERILSSIDKSLNDAKCLIPDQSHADMITTKKMENVDNSTTNLKAPISASQVTSSLNRSRGKKSGDNDIISLTEILSTSMKVPATVSTSALAAKEITDSATLSKPVGTFADKSANYDCKPKLASDKPVRSSASKPAVSNDDGKSNVTSSKPPVRSSANKSTVSNDDDKSNVTSDKPAARPSASKSAVLNDDNISSVTLDKHARPTSKSAVSNDDDRSNVALDKPAPHPSASKSAVSNYDDQSNVTSDKPVRPSASKSNVSDDDNKSSVASDMFVRPFASKPAISKDDSKSIVTSDKSLLSSVSKSTVSSDDDKSSVTSDTHVRPSASKSAVSNDDKSRVTACKPVDSPNKSAVSNDDNISSVTLDNPAHPTSKSAVSNDDDKSNVASDKPAPRPSASKSDVSNDDDKSGVTSDTHVRPSTSKPAVSNDDKSSVTSCKPVDSANKLAVSNDDSKSNVASDKPVCRASKSNVSNDDDKSSITSYKPARPSASKSNVSKDDDKSSVTSNKPARPSASKSNVSKDDDKSSVTSDKPARPSASKSNVSKDDDKSSVTSDKPAHPSASKSNVSKDDKSSVTSDKSVRPSASKPAISNDGGKSSVSSNKSLLSSVTESTVSSDDDKSSVTSDTHERPASKSSVSNDDKSSITSCKLVDSANKSAVSNDDSKCNVTSDKPVRPSVSKSAVSNDDKSSVTLDKPVRPPTSNSTISNDGKSSVTSDTPIDYATKCAVSNDDGKSNVTSDKPVRSASKPTLSNDDVKSSVTPDKPKRSSASKSTVSNADGKSNVTSGKPVDPSTSKSAISNDDCKSSVASDKPVDSANKSAVSNDESKSKIIKPVAVEDVSKNTSTSDKITSDIKIPTLDKVDIPVDKSVVKSPSGAVPDNVSVLAETKKQSDGSTSEVIKEKLAEVTTVTKTSAETLEKESTCTKNVTVRGSSTNKKSVAIASAKAKAKDYAVESSPQIPNKPHSKDSNENVNTITPKEKLPSKRITRRTRSSTMDKPPDSTPSKINKEVPVENVVSTTLSKLEENKIKANLPQVCIRKIDLPDLGEKMTESINIAHFDVEKSESVKEVATELRKRGKGTAKIQNSEVTPVKPRTRGRPSLQSKKNKLVIEETEELDTSTNEAKHSTKTVVKASKKDVEITSRSNRELRERRVPEKNKVTENEEKKAKGKQLRGKLAVKAASKEDLNKSVGRQKNKNNSESSMKVNEVRSFTRSRAQLAKDKELSSKTDTGKENLNQMENTNNEQIIDMGDIEEQIVRTEIRPSKKPKLADSVEITVVDKNKRVVTTHVPEKSKASEKVADKEEVEKKEVTRGRRTSTRLSVSGRTENTGKNVKEQSSVVNTKQEDQISTLEEKKQKVEKQEEEEEDTKPSESKDNLKELKPVEEPKCIQKKVALLTCVDINKLKSDDLPSESLQDVKDDVKEKHDSLQEQPSSVTENPDDVKEKSDDVKEKSDDMKEKLSDMSDSDGFCGIADDGGDSSDDIAVIPDSDPLADSDDSKGSTKHSQPMTLATFKLDLDDSSPAPLMRVTRKRAAQQSIDALRETRPQGKITENENKDSADSKRPKLKRKRSVDRNLRRSIEEKKAKEVSSSEDDAVGQLSPQSQMPIKEESGKKSKAVVKRRISTRSTRATESPAPSSDAQSEASRTDTSNTPPVSKQRKPRQTKKTLLGLEISPETESFIKGDTPMGVRQSRRIAQIKIKEEAERRKLEEVTLQDLKDEQRKRKGKKDEDKDYKLEKRKRNKNLPTEDETTTGDAESDEKKKRKRKRKHRDPRKHFDALNPWKSSSGSSSSEVEEEEDEIEEDDDHPLVFKSDHEFSPESDLEEGGEIQPLKRARTARKESDAEEVDDCACQKCGQKDHPEWILLCDSCDCGWHCSCLRPALLVIPEGDWFCPPCQHVTLVKNLESQLLEYDKRLNKRVMETRRKERLAYVGISLDNVLPAKESDEHRNKQRHYHKDDDDDNREENDSDSDSDDSGSDSDSSSSSDSDSEPIYQLRERRQAHSYRFNDYDELINSAIQDELDAVKGAGNQGRGKDISTIVNAEKEEEARLKNEAAETNIISADGVPTDLTVAATAITETETSVLEPLPPVVPVDYDRKPDDESDDEPIRPVRKIIGKKKHRKLNSLDVSSGDDAESDEDFKGSSSDSEEEDFDDDEYAGSESSDDVDTRRGKRRKDFGPVRRSTRARISRYDRDFVNDDDTDSEDDAPRRKKTRSLWDESESEESDRSWGRRKRKAAKSRKKPSAKPKKSKKKKKRAGDDSDPEVYRKRPNIKFGGLNDDEEIGRRTRGKKINYLEALGTDSEEEIRRKPPRIEESEEEYIVHEDEDFQHQLANEKDSDESGVDTVLQDLAMVPHPKSNKPRGRGKSGLKIPRKPKEPPPPDLFPPLLSDVPQPPNLQAPIMPMEPAMLQQPLVTHPLILEPPIIQEQELQDMEDEPNPIEQINKNVEQMNEQEMEKMMEEEDYANKQLQLVALQIEKEKKRKEREAKRLEKLVEKEQKIPKKRGRKPKNQMLGIPADLGPPFSDSTSMLMNSAMANNAELSEPPGVNLPMFSEIAPVLNADGSPKKRRGRGKGKKTLAAEAAAIAAAAAANKDSVDMESGLEGPASSGSNTVSPAPDSPMHGSKLGIATPPQPFSQSQPTPSVITRMLQSQPGQGNFPGGVSKYFGGPPGDPQLGPPGSGPYHPGATGPRGQIPGPYQQPPPGMSHYPVVRSGPAPPHRLHSPGPPGLPPMYHAHRSLDPSPSGGGPINVATANRDRHSPAVVPPASSSPLSKGDPTPPPPPYTRPQVGHFPPVTGASSLAATGSRHVSMVPPHLQQHRASNMSPYHPGVPPNYHYGSYPPPPPLTTDEGQPPPGYPSSAYPESYPAEGGAPIQPPEGSGVKSFDEDTGGEFVGLVSYFSSQREDDLDT